MNKKTDNTDVIVQNSLINSSVEKMIQVIRDKQVLLDRDLATLYGVETKRINEQVKRNKERFPEDFCFLLTMEETKILRSQKRRCGQKFRQLVSLNIVFDNLRDSSRSVRFLSVLNKTIPNIFQVPL